MLFSRSCMTEIETELDTAYKYRSNLPYSCGTRQEIRYNC